MAIRECGKGMMDAIVVLLIAAAAIAAPVVIAVWLVATSEVHDPLTIGNGVGNTD